MSEQLRYWGNCGPLIPPLVAESFAKSGAKTYDQQYRKLMEYSDRHFRALKELIDHARLATVLDIGCGLAAVDVLIARYTSVKTIHLLDGLGKSGGRKRGFGDPVTPWGDVRLGEQLVRANVPATVKVVAHPVETISDVRRANAELNISVDLAISLRSLGHHYPVGTYLDLLKRVVVHSGALVLDIRKGLDGDAQHRSLEANGFWRTGEVPSWSHKSERCIYERGERPE